MSTDVYFKEDEARAAGLVVTEGEDELFVLPEGRTTAYRSSSYGWMFVSGSAYGSIVGEARAALREAGVHHE